MQVLGLSAGLVVLTLALLALLFSIPWRLRQRHQPGLGLWRYLTGARAPYEGRRRR